MEVIPNDTLIKADLETAVQKPEECQQLKNIKFKNMLLTGNNNNNTEVKMKHSKKANIDLFLEDSNFDDTSCFFGGSSLDTVFLELELEESALKLTERQISLEFYC